MIIYKDAFTGDELFSDSVPMKLINNIVYKLKGTMRTDVFDIDDSAIGGNKSAEVQDEGADAASKQGVDIVLNGRLVEYTLAKKDYLPHIKAYMKQVKERLEKELPDQVEVFTSNAQNFIKEVLADYKEYQLFSGESMHPDGMLALMKWEDDVPYMYFFKHGLIEEKVVSTHFLRLH
ncbi:hypothetical protein HELRODRAFT_168939 [Helobdella robusta]|uniref:Translationally-controlled tumor protein homolog n=1 Tax=Helobdella robusta TaxID=6412 RepID=T1F159_HELRO|nr:hypothetical protein HELRODRAFT_168939 [Helobdella robusta]ESO09007.1 hypothetical protein HELRODRAFT_168939 [Helobdella robusta]